jgi:AMP-polyphosphate phosphotransferase
MISLKEYNSSNTIPDTDFKSVEEDLQERLYILFSEAFNQKRSVIIVLEGWAASGKGDILNTIARRLDPRRIHFYSFMSDMYANTEYPFLHKYWNRLPPYGDSIIFDGSWYSGVSYRKKNGIITKDKYLASFRSIKNFETLLTKDRYLLQKFFLNISEKEQTKRLEKAEKAGHSWKVSETDWEQNHNYSEYKKLFEFYLNETNLPECSWNVISAKDKNFARLTLLNSMIHFLEDRLSINSYQVLHLLKEKEGKK